MAPRRPPPPKNTSAKDGGGVGGGLSPDGNLVRVLLEDLEHRDADVRRLKRNWRRQRSASSKLTAPRYRTRRRQRRLRVDEAVALVECGVAKIVEEETSSEQDRFRYRVRRQMRSSTTAAAAAAAAAVVVSSRVWRQSHTQRRRVWIPTGRKPIRHRQCLRNPLE